MQVALTELRSFLVELLANFRFEVGGIRFVSQLSVLTVQCSPPTEREQWM